MPHVQCPIDNRYGRNSERKHSPHSILDLFGLRSFYTEICRRFTLPQLYAYPRHGIDSSDSEEEEEKSDNEASKSSEYN